MFREHASINEEDVRSLKENWSKPFPLLLVLGFSLLIWLIDGTIEYLFYSSQSFFDILVLEVPGYVLYRRFSFILIFVTYSIVFSFFYLSKIRTERRENFLDSLLTHDLRNKCQVILGELELLKNSSDLSEKDLNKVDASINSTMELLSLTDKVRTWVKSMKSKESYELNIGDLKSVIKDIIDNKNSERSGRDIVFDFEINASTDLRINAPPLMREIIGNLIENCYFHSDCERIKISLKEESDFLVISLCDDGVGIPRENWDEVFDLDYSRKPSSGGLGLYLVKKILNENDGDISICESELGGAKFKIKLKKIK